MSKKNSIGKKPRKAWIEWVIIALVAGATLYSMRPSGEVKLAKKIAAQKDDFMEKYGDDLADSTTDTSSKSSAKENSVPSESSSAPVRSANISYAEHGTGALLRVKEHLKKNKKTLPLIENPNFDAPIRLSFHALKKIYAVYRLKGGVFPPVAVEKLNGAAIEISGAVMPVDPVPDDGTLVRFWLANPVVVLAGCVFCNPPTMADLILVTTPFGESPLRINREQLFKSIVMVKMRGRLLFGPNKDGKVEYMFKMDSHKIIPVN